MVDQMTSQDRKPATFNGPLEAGIRAVSILGAAYPQSYDLQRLVALDYLLVHTSDVGGPESLHPPTRLSWRTTAWRTPSRRPRTTWFQSSARIW